RSARARPAGARRRAAGRPAAAGSGHDDPHPHRLARGGRAPAPGRRTRLAARARREPEGARRGLGGERRQRRRGRLPRSGRGPGEARIRAHAWRDNARARVAHVRRHRPVPLSMEELDPRTLARVRRGDQQAFAALVRHYDPGLRALAFRLLGDRTRMDDALQETYVKAYRALPGFRGESSPGTWLYRIAYNACLDELKRTRAVVDLEAVRERAHDADPAEALSLRQTLGRAL